MYENDSMKKVKKKPVYSSSFIFMGTIQKITGSDPKKGLAKVLNTEL